MKLAANMNRNLSLLRCGFIILSQSAIVPFWQYAAAMPLCDGSMSRTISLSCPGTNRFPDCHPNVLVESAFFMMSMFSASSAAKNFTMCFAFSDVTVHPKSASAVMALDVKMVLRGYIALCHCPSLLNATSIFSSPVSMLRSRCVIMIGVLHTMTGAYFFSSITLIPFSE